MQHNNDREWFRANKAEYEALREQWLIDMDRLIADMGQWWPELRGLTGKQCAYRNNRDTHNSPTTSPHKDYISTGITTARHNAREPRRLRGMDGILQPQLSLPKLRLRPSARVNGRNAG